MEIDTQTVDTVPVRDNDLARAQSVATISTSSGDDTEKRHSTHSSTHSVDSGNSRDDAEKKFLTTSSASGDYVHLQAASDTETAAYDESKKKVKKSKSFLQKHGDKIKSKLSFRKKSKPKMETKTGTWLLDLDYYRLTLKYYTEMVITIGVVASFNKKITKICQREQNRLVATPPSVILLLLTLWKF